MYLRRIHCAVKLFIESYRICLLLLSTTRIDLFTIWYEWLNQTDYTGNFTFLHDVHRMVWSHVYTRCVTVWQYSTYTMNSIGAPVSNKEAHMNSSKVYKPTRQRAVLQFVGVEYTQVHVCSVVPSVVSGWRYWHLSISQHACVSFFVSW